MTPSAVFLHGFLGGSDDWLPVLAAFGEGEGICRPTLPGHSPEAPAEDPACWIDAQMRVYGSVRFHLVGYSMGGRVALQWALRYPAMIRTLTLISADPGIDDPAERLRRCAIDDARADRILRGRFEEFLGDWYRQPIFAGLAEDSALFARLLTTRASPSRGLADMVSLMSPGRQPSMWPQVPELAMPSLWIAGERDEKYVTSSRRAADLCRRSRARIVPAASHAVHLQKPAEVSALIQAWWRNNE